jgi:hypothetical protein
MRDYLMLTKPRITMLILICVAVGFVFGSRTSPHYLTLLHVLVGTALMASGTSALNQWYEADSDAQMTRTRERPIPAGRLKRGRALAFGLLVSAAGFTELLFGTNALAAALGALTLITYLLIYTPLKTRSPACTTVGALPGAMPPLIGYAAARGYLDVEAMALFLVLFVWQFPHFYAIVDVSRRLRTWRNPDVARGRAGRRLDRQTYSGVCKFVDPGKPRAPFARHDGACLRRRRNCERIRFTLFRSKSWPRAKRCQRAPGTTGFRRLLAGAPCGDGNRSRRFLTTIPVR